jgi:hypothetical protein
VAGKGGPNMFPDPKAALEAFDYEMPGGIGTRNCIRGDGIFNVDASLWPSASRMPYADGVTPSRSAGRCSTYRNTVKFDVADASLDISTAGTFGKYSTQLTSPRVMQFGLRYEF